MISSWSSLKGSWKGPSSLSPSIGLTSKWTSCGSWQGYLWGWWRKFWALDLLPSVFCNTKYVTPRSSKAQNILRLELVSGDQIERKTYFKVWSSTSLQAGRDIIALKPFLILYIWNITKMCKMIMIDLPFWRVMVVIKIWIINYSEVQKWQYNTTFSFKSHSVLEQVIISFITFHCSSSFTDIGIALFSSNLQ